MTTIVDIRHFHFFAGLGGGAMGFNRGEARVGNLEARFRCIGGIDVLPLAIADFGNLAGVPGTLLDLFSREQYVDFHGREPPDGWREATADDVRRAAGGERPHIVFLSPPCKGFSGLLAESKSRSPKYQALNGLTVRGVMLMMEAWADDPPELIILENVPRISKRGRHLVDQITAILRSNRYAVAETAHDCGEIGNLAESRKRFLMVGRHVDKVPPFLYEPRKHPLRGVGEVIGKLPVPGPDPLLPMHRVPSLQWKTWVRLAFVEAGSDWRSLNRLNVKDGLLTDFALLPEYGYNDVLGVTPWDRHASAVTSRGRPTNGNFAVADPRPPADADRGAFGVGGWDDPAGTITSQRSPGQGKFSVADPRIDGHAKSVQLGVGDWNTPAATIKGDVSVGTGRYAVADPRIDRTPFNHVYSVVQWDQASGAVTAGHGPSSGGQAVADPRPGERFDYRQTKYRVTRYDEPAGTVISASTTGNGAFCVADPRPKALNQRRDAYMTGGHYGVVPWQDPSGAVPAYAKYDRGRWAVADPRGGQGEPAIVLPAANDRLVCRIRSLDGTWHRPFTTAELAAIQGLLDPESTLELAGLSDSDWRERIGNAVPPPAAQAIASVMGRTLLMAWSGQSFLLSNEPIWVQPIALALAVQPADAP